MKGKRRSVFLTKRLGAGLWGFALALSASISLTGCGNTASSSEAAKQTQSAQVTTVQSQTAETITTAEPDSSSGGEQTQKAKTTTKTTAPQTQKRTTETTKKSTPSGTQAQNQPPATQAASQAAEPGVTQSVSAAAEPANATAVQKATSAYEKKTQSSTETIKKPEGGQVYEYHLYADGYVTKYDELKLKNLTDKQRRAYDALSDGIWKMKKYITLPEKTIRQEEASDFLYTVLGTMPEVNYVRGTYRISVSGGYIKKYTIDYTLSTDEAERQHKQLRAAAAKIINGLDPGMSDFEKVKYFHDTIVLGCEYDKGDGVSSYTAYGCLVEGKAVCEGYAMALDYLCEKAGIYSLLISGESTNSAGTVQSHIWNKIRLDGKWYNFDTTWDDPVSSFGEGYIRYDYFAVTDDELSLTHKVDKNRFGYYPAADDRGRNYFKEYGFFIDTPGYAGEAVTKAFEKMLAEGRRVMSIRCSDDEVYADTLNLLMSSDEQTGLHTVYTYLKQATEGTGLSCDYGGYYLVKNERLRIAAIIIKQP